MGERSIRAEFAGDVGARVGDELIQGEQGGDCSDKLDDANGSKHGYRAARIPDDHRKRNNRALSDALSDGLGGRAMCANGHASPDGQP